VDTFHLEVVNVDVMPLRVRFTRERETIFVSSSPGGTITPPLSSALSDHIVPAQSGPGQYSGREISVSKSAETPHQLQQRREMWPLSHPTYGQFLQY